MANAYTVMDVIRESQPVFRKNCDKVAFVVHASFKASGFRLVGVAGQPDSPTLDEVGIDGWNDEFNEYAFVYVNPSNGSKKILVKCLVEDDKLVVNAVDGDETEPAHLEIQVGNYAAESGEEGDYDAQFKNFDKLVTDLQNQILYKLDPELKPLTYFTQSIPNFVRVISRHPLPVRDSSLGLKCLLTDQPGTTKTLKSPRSPGNSQE